MDSPAVLFIGVHLADAAAANLCTQLFYSACPDWLAVLVDEKVVWFHRGLLSTPRPRTLLHARVSALGQAASFSSSPAVRSISSRLSVFFTERAWAVAATVTSQRVSIGRPSSSRWTAWMAGAICLPNRFARNVVSSSSTRLLRAASMA